MSLGVLKLRDERALSVMQALLEWKAIEQCWTTHPNLEVSAGCRSVYQETDPIGGPLLSTVCCSFLMNVPQEESCTTKTFDAQQFSRYADEAHVNRYRSMHGEARFAAFGAAFSLA